MHGSKRGLQGEGGLTRAAAACCARASAPLRRIFPDPPPPPRARTTGVCASRSIGSNHQFARSGVAPRLTAVEDKPPASLKVVKLSLIWLLAHGLAYSAESFSGGIDDEAATPATVSLDRDFQTLQEPAVNSLDDDPASEPKEKNSPVPAQEPPPVSAGLGNDSSAPIASPVQAFSGSTSAPSCDDRPNTDGGIGLDESDSPQDASPIWKKLKVKLCIDLDSMYLFNQKWDKQGV